jgi:pyruvate formate lyase activating enzyme
VAEWVCPGGTECGFPQFSHAKIPEWGFKNLAVFLKSCTFNCLFCQNWHYREESLTAGQQRTEAIAEEVDDRTSCVCYFGGDPTPQIHYALKASERALERAKGILRICWETNGSMNPQLLDKAAALSLESGGCIKFDLKAWHRELHYALCGTGNEQTLANFEQLAEYIPKRPSPPFLIASTLLVPGYIDEAEVREIASFIASLDPYIPYSLLGFCPHFEMQDLPRTSARHAERCRKAALDSGLKRVKIGNVHLLGDSY